MRASKLRALAAAALPVLAGVALATVSPAASEAAPAAGAAFPAHYSAPYLQVSDSDIGDMAADMNATGTKFFTLAFLTPSSGCNQLWEANGTGVGSFKSQISALQAAGGNVIPSFGGAAGGEIAQTCTNTSSLTAAYANVVNTYGTNRLDFDIEEDTIKDTAANQRRNSALAALQQQNPNVQVDYTLAVDPSGLGSLQMGILNDAYAKGVKVSVVNLMVMDFYDGQPVLGDALASARAAVGQIAGAFHISTAQAYAKMGLTPIAGRNDDGAQFSQSDAQQLESFAAQNGVQELSFWEVHDYDRATGYAYSRIFNAITGGGGTTPPPTGGGKQITGYGGKCVDVAGANSANGTKIDLYTCNGTNAQQWTSAGGTLQALGKCMDVAAAGTASGTKVQLYDCNGTAAQQWTHTAANQLVNTGSGKCLDATGPSSADGTPLQIWTCTGAANQAWTF
ncbi:ricin-type beta-trefoil lectin domain protein [Amycolatopsis sp. FDAARGOS 1241]|uniref:ricin-type beta-trefoil lectin domain protein n=1 Tax=Amycolatopsis sp. FDAARGOS 1241 TaxID=2778070 RepID=UPI00195290CC|nr:ricin-type beta-trefoil lectin domain protein [Amycolatopsis sp. FDAARGOS 1241]QRP47145.1 ricin-type beta-trefoil lectin domain protein [Amycolatopsis sp. FDAARGOS 1241]